MVSTDRKFSAQPQRMQLASQPWRSQVTVQPRRVRAVIALAMGFVMVGMTPVYMSTSHKWATFRQVLGGSKLFAMLVLHVYHPAKRLDDQAATWAFLSAVQADLGVPVVHYPTEGADGYWRALELVWAYPGDIVTVEQDIVPTVDQIAELGDCPQGYCAFDFRLANGVPWSDLADGHGFGLAKFSEARRAAIVARPAVPHVPWPDTVPFVHETLKPVHVHRPAVEHHHGLA